MTRPTDLGTWNGVAEIVLMTMGAVALYAGVRGTRGRTATVARLVTGFCALVFGATHFKYVQFTATMVRPGFRPTRSSGRTRRRRPRHRGPVAGRGIRSQLGATLLAGMMAVFVLLVQYRGVCLARRAPGVDHVGVALSLSGAAWLVRKYAA